MRTYLLAVCALLAACGNREQPKPDKSMPQSSMQQPPPAAQDDRPVIVAFGDSLSAGFGVDSGQSYPDFLQKELDRRGLKYRVVNGGISGDTSSDGLERMDYVIAMKPAIVIVEFGANDGLRGMPVTSTRANLEQIVGGLQKAGARVVLAGMTLPPNYGPDYIDSFERIYTDLAAKNKAVLIPFLLEGVAGDKRFMQADGLHANVEGNRKVAQTVMKTLAPLLRE
jgi:acyl-CoA thioesterase-1